MYGIRSILVASLLLFGISMTQCWVLPHGVCRPDKIDIFPINYNETFSMGCWEMVYVTEAEIFRDVDHACFNYIPNDNGTFTLYYIRVYENGTEYTEKFYNSYRNGIIFNKYMNVTTGERVIFQDYPLVVTRNKAALIIRCSCGGGVAVDVRYVIIPEQFTLKNDDIREIMGVDNRFDFEGTLVELPQKLKKETCCKNMS